MEENKLYPEGTVQQTDDFAMRQKIKKIVRENIENIIKEETISAFKKMGYDEKDGYMFVVAAGGKDNKENEIGKGTAEGKLTVTVSTPKMLNMGATKPVSYMQKNTTFGGKKIISEIYLEIKDKSVHINYKNTEAGSFTSSSSKDTYAPNKLNKSGVISSVENESKFKKDFKSFFKPIAEAEAEYLIGTKIGNDDKIEKNMNDSIVKENKFSMKLTELLSGTFEDVDKKISRIVNESIDGVRFPSFVNQHVSFAVASKNAAKVQEILFGLGVRFQTASTGGKTYFQFDNVAELGFAAEEVSKEVPLMYSTYIEKPESLNESTTNDEFVAHGHYTVSNAGGYEIMLADSGDAARVKDAFGSDNPEISDWLEIEYVKDDDTGELEPVIDPNGYNIPLNMVMRVKRENNKDSVDGTPETPTGKPTEDDLLVGSDEKIEEITASGAGIGGPTQPSGFKYPGAGWSKDGKTPNLKANKDYTQIQMNEEIKKTTYGIMRTPRAHKVRQDDGTYKVITESDLKSPYTQLVPMGPDGWPPRGMEKHHVMGLHDVDVNSKDELKRTGHGNLNLIKETGEWDEHDKEMVMWKNGLENEVKRIEQEFPEQVEIESVRGFDKYQGPYAYVKIGDGFYDIWTTGEGYEQMILWIDGFVIDNTSSEGGRPGYMGTTDQIIEMLREYFGTLNENKKLSLIKRKFAVLSENEESGINKRYIITEKLTADEQKRRWKKLYECDCFCGIKDNEQNLVTRDEYEDVSNEEFEANNETSIESNLCDTQFSGKEKGFIDIPKATGSMVVFRISESDVKSNKTYVIDHFTKKLVLNPLYKSKK